jgi:hypothetical protein
MQDQFKKEIISKVKYFRENILKNMRALERFYNHKFYLFAEQKILIDENLDCLLIGLNQASIVTTNHLMERMLKVALIKFHTMHFSVGDPELQTKLGEAKQKYDGKYLFESIKNAFDRKIINEEEKKELLEFKDKFRNPYSHAEISKIVTDTPSTFSGHLFSFKEIENALQKGEKIPVGEKTEVPTDIMYQIIQVDKADCVSFDYFQQVFTIMCNIDERYKSESR